VGKPSKMMPLTESSRGVWTIRVSISSWKSGQEFAWWDTEASRQFHDDIERRVASATFQATHVRPIQADMVGK